MAHEMMCPLCGNRGESSTSIDDGAAFEVRGQFEGRAIRKCRKCASGLIVGPLSGLFVGKPQVIPKDIWHHMEEIWKREFGPDQDSAAAALPASYIPEAGTSDVASPGLPVLAVGSGHSLAVAADGTVWAWGWNCVVPITDRLTPVQVQGMTDVVGIAAGHYHKLALRRDGTVWAWGWNEHGQLGDGTTTGRLTPVQVQGLPDVGP